MRACKMGLLSLFKKCFFPSEEPLPRSDWKKATLLILVNHYELDYEIKDRKNGDTLDDFPIEEYDRSKHHISFEGEQYYKRKLSRV